MTGSLPSWKSSRKETISRAVCAVDSGCTFQSGEDGRNMYFSMCTPIGTLSITSAGTPPGGDARPGADHLWPQGGRHGQAVTGWQSRGGSHGKAPRSELAAEWEEERETGEGERES